MSEIIVPSQTIIKGRITELYFLLSIVYIILFLGKLIEISTAQNVMSSNNYNFQLSKNAPEYSKVVSTADQIVRKPFYNANNQDDSGAKTAFRNQSLYQGIDHAKQPNTPPKKDDISPKEPQILNGVCNIPSLNPCDSMAKCISTVPIIGRAVCVCPQGYAGDGKKIEQGGEGCVNIDECTSGLHNCDLKTEDCVDVQGSFYCKCKSGYALSPSGTMCIDIDECQNPALNNCDPETTVCHNLEGSYRCDCIDPKKIVDPVSGICRFYDECTEMNGAMNPCEHLCFKKEEGVQCDCRQGYKLNDNGRTCDDIDECALNLHSCDPKGIISKCINTDGSYYCECNRNLGYETAEDGKTCQNLDECKEYPYICGGALSCCMDLPPPQRFACTWPIDDNVMANPSNLEYLMNNRPLNPLNLLGGRFNLRGPSNAAGLLASTVGRLIPNPMAMNGLLSAPMMPRSITNNPQDYYMNSAPTLSLSNVSQYGQVSNGSDNLFVHNIGDQGHMYPGTKNFSRSDKIKEINRTEIEANQRKLFPMFQLQSQLLPSNLRLIPKNYIGTSLSGDSGNSGSGLRIGRGSTCPPGFTLGADLNRAKVREGTKNFFKSALKPRINPGDGSSTFIQPEYFSDGLIENTKLISNEIARWYSELARIPYETFSAAANPLMAAVDQNTNNVPSSASTTSNGGLIPTNYSGSSSRDSVASLAPAILNSVGSGIGSSLGQSLTKGISSILANGIGSPLGPN